MRQWNDLRQHETATGDEASGRRTRHPTKGNKKGFNGRHRETTPVGKRTHSQTQAEGRRWETRGDKTLGKADAPSNKRRQEGKQLEMRENTRRLDLEK